MPAPDNLDWLYHVLGWALAAAGVLLLLWSLFWDRSRGRRRCPKCWYDMAGVPGLKCPECGRETRRERSFHRTRRRLGAALLGVVLMLGAAAVPVVALATRGWAAMPTTVVIAALELKGWPRSSMGTGPGYANEIAKRLRNLSGWQRDLAMRRMARYWAFDYRREWPAGVPFALRLADEWWYVDGQSNCTLRARLLNGTNGAGDWVFLHGGLFQSMRWNADFWREGFCELGAMPAGTTEATLELQVVHLDAGGKLTGQKPTWSGMVSLPIKIRETVDDIIKPVASPAIDKEIHDGFVVFQGVNNGRHFAFVLDGTARSEGVTTAFRVEIVRGDKIISACTVWDDGALGPVGTPLRRLGDGLSFGDQWQEVQALSLADPEWFVRIRSMPELALRDLTSEKYWDGEVIIRPNEIRKHSAGRW